MDAFSRQIDAVRQQGWQMDPTFERDTKRALDRMQADINAYCIQTSVSMGVQQLQRLAGTSNLDRAQVLKIVGSPEADFWEWDVEAVLDVIPLSQSEHEQLNSAISKLEGHVVADVMKIMESTIEQTGLDEYHSASSVTLDMLPIPTQRKLQRWVEDNTGKRGLTKVGVAKSKISLPAASELKAMNYRELQAECKRRGLRCGKKQEMLDRLAADSFSRRVADVDTDIEANTAILSEKVENQVMPVQSTTSGAGASKRNARVAKTFRYRQEVFVFWKDENDQSPPNDSDWYPAIVTGNMKKDPTEEGKYRIQYQAEGNKKGQYTGEYENNVEERFLRPVMRKAMRKAKRKAAKQEPVEGLMGMEMMDYEATEPQGAQEMATLPPTTSMAALAADITYGVEDNKHSIKRQCQVFAPPVLLSAYPHFPISPVVPVAPGSTRNDSSNSPCVKLPLVIKRESEADSDSDSDCYSEHEDGPGPLKFRGNPDALDSYGCRHG